jgi:serine/threonine protein phosphatase PrpC
VKVTVGVRSDVGRVREGNEDSYLATDPLFVVADGMGGHIAGDVASSTAVEVISNERDSVDVDDADTLTAIVRHANSAIWEKAQEDPSLQGMGTTCTLLMIEQDRARLAHVGDSRAYLLRDEELSQLTEDHTLVGRMVREGRLSAEEAERHPQRSVITRALGVDSDIDVDIVSLQLEAKDRLLLCSDGLTSMVGHDVIRSTLAEEADPQRAADRLVDIANRAGGEDNVTVVVVDVDGGPGGDAPAEARSDEAVESSPPPPPPEPEIVKARSRGRWKRRLVGGVLVLALVAAGGYLLARSLLNNSFFVGVNEEGMVTIFRGIPDEVAGLDLRQEEQTTELLLTDLPPFLRDDVEEGRIKTDTLEDAEQRVSTLEANAESFGGEEAGPEKTDR